MKWLRQFRLTVTEKKGFLALAVILIAFLAFRVLLSFWPTDEALAKSTLENDVAVWQAEQKAKLLVPHRFDPNTVSTDFVQSLPLNKFAKENWTKFLNKKWRFYKPEDVLKIYGMDTLWYTVNQDSIIIGEANPVDQTKNSSTKFPFNPNTATESELLELGFPDWLVKRVLAYRAKGGTFKTAADLQKIYNFPEELFAELQPFIVIDAEKNTENPKQKPNFATVIVEINSADSVQLLQVQGIGPAFANRILKYRKQLGGFSNIIQLLEVYGFDAEKLENVKAQFVVDAALIQKLNINKDEFKILLNHPYLDYKQVKAIVGYREQIGPLKSISELINLEGFTAKDIERLNPYLSVR